MFSIIGTIILGGFAGLIAGLIRKGEGYGIITNIFIGILGQVVHKVNKLQMQKII